MRNFFNKSLMKKSLMILMLAVLFLGSGVISTKAADTVAYTISANPGEDANHEVRINWHTDLNVTGVYVAYTKKSDTNWNNVKKVNGTSVVNDAFLQKNAIPLIEGKAILQWGAVLSNLDEDTDYMYKIGNDDNSMSEVRYFKTGTQAYSFIWTSDIHTYYDDARRLNAATKNINEAITINGGVDFILSTGDMIAHGGTYKWWQQLADISWMKNYMFTDTLGNHDWMTSTGTNVADGASNIFFGATHNFPKNGYAGQEGICYYYMYGDTLFIVLNTEEYTAAQYEWCESVLKNNDAQYKVIVQHYEAFTGNGSKKSSGYTRWHTLCDEYDVDLFLSGNSHSYIRTNPIYKDTVSTDVTKGTTYMVAPSSDGDRGVDFTGITNNQDLIAYGWAGGVYQVACSIVTVDIEKITVRLVNNGGTILDTVTIPAKRGPSARYSSEVTTDKDAFEESIKYIPSQSASGYGYLNFNYCPDVLRVDLYKGENAIYSHSMLTEVNCAFAIPEDSNEYIVKILYADATQGIKTIKKIANGDFGEIKDFKVEIENGKYKLSWNATLTNIVKELQVFVDGNYIKTISKDLKSVELDISGNLLEVRVIDQTSNILYSLTTQYRNYGDTNLDGVITKDDVKKVLNHILGIELLTGKNLEFADANLDEIIDLRDANYIIMLADKKISKLADIKYTVTFRGPANNVLNSQKVSYGEAASAPQFNGSDIWRFIRWSVDFSSITKDLDVYAVCEIVPSDITLTGSTKAKKGEPVVLTATVNERYAMQSLIWKSSDPNIAVVNSDGIVTFITSGTVTISACSVVDQNVKGTITITCEGDITKEMDVDAVVYSNTNAKEYVADNITFKWTALVYQTLQEAYNAVPVGGKILVLPGEYSGNLMIDKAITIIGINDGIEVGPDRKAEAVLSGKIGIKANNVKLSGLKFDNKTTQSGVNITGLIYTTGGADLANIEISYNDISSAGLASHSGIIRLGNSADNTTLENIVISHNKIHAAGTNSAISNRYRDNTQASPEIGNRTILKNVTISNNVITGALFGGLNLELGANGSMTISNNQITAGTDHSIRFNSGSGTVTLIGHTAAEVKFGTTHSVVLDIK